MQRLARLRAIITVMLMCGSAGVGEAADAPRIASINVCTDQLLLTLADPAQILGLGPYARDPEQSWNAAEAARFPRLSGAAEDVLALRPDIVVAGSFGARATRELLKENGLRVEEFDNALSLDDAKAQMIRMGDIVGHPDRAKAEIAKLDAAIAESRASALRQPVRVLALSRRGWVTGDHSLTGSLLAAAGITNAAAELGLKGDGFASLESIVALKPDYLLVDDVSNRAGDEGRAFLLHPALQRLYPASKRIVLPERLTVCGGPALTIAVRALTAELARIAR